MDTRVEFVGANERRLSNLPGRDVSSTLFVIATPAEADALMRAQPDDPRWRWTWMDQNTATLGVLGAVLHGQDANAEGAIAFLDWKVLAEDEGGEGPWVCQLPERLVSPLRSADLAWLAAEWARARFMRSYEESELRTFLHELRTLLEEAERESRELLYWELQ